MPVAELVKEYLALLVSWPVAAIIIAVILGKVFRTEIAGLIRRVRRIKAGPVDVAIVAQEAETSQALRSKVEADVVHSIIRPFIPRLVTHIQEMCRTLTEPTQDIRATLYLPWPLDSEYLVQVTPYIPRGPDKTGRLLSKRVGAVGRAFTTGAVVRETMPANLSEFKKKHVEQWRFESLEAERLQSDRRSYLAVPVRTNDERLGVAFFDSNDPNMFRDEITNQAKQRVTQLASVVAILHYQLNALRA